MHRKFRLTKTTDFERVRRLGESYAHPLVVLIASPNGLDQPRFGFTASKTIGKAIRRNRAKRVLRESLRELCPSITAGSDILLIARPPIIGASYQEVLNVLKNLLIRAGLFIQPVYEPVGNKI